MIDGKRGQPIISLVALIALAIHIFRFALIDTLSLVFFVIAIIPWIISLKPSWEYFNNIAVISVIAFTFIFFHIINPQLFIDNISITLVLFSMLPWIVPYVGNLNKKTLIQIGISIISFFILVVHISRPRLTIDTVTVSLLIISIIPWVTPFLKSLEVPGIAKVEFKYEIEEVTQKAEDAGLLSKKTNPESARYGVVNILPSKRTDSKDELKPEYLFQQIAENDPNLALADLRIEIEKKLNFIAKCYDLKIRNSLSVDIILEFLYNEDILSLEEKSVISELINLLNKAVHGAEIDKSTAHRAISTGQGILNTLDTKLINSLFSDKEFVRITSGDFCMGSLSEEKDRYNDEVPIRKVIVKNSFDISKYPITQKQWIAVMRYNHSGFKGEERPVENVSWEEVEKFIKKLNETMGAKKYRLPSEAEWEYACRAGTESRYSFGDDESMLGDYAWHSRNSENETHSVGQRKPNDWKLYDMHGDVWEWVQDKWHDNYEGAPSDSSAWEEGDSSIRVLRGGSWNDRASECRSASRKGKAQKDKRVNCGFRIVREL